LIKGSFETAAAGSIKTASSDVSIAGTGIGSEIGRGRPALVSAGVVSETTTAG
jgi:hypothetical protein